MLSGVPVAQPLDERDQPDTRCASGSYDGDQIRCRRGPVASKKIGEVPGNRLCKVNENLKRSRHSGSHAH